MGVRHTGAFRLAIVLAFLAGAAPILAQDDGVLAKTLAVLEKAQSDEDRDALAKRAAALETALEASATLPAEARIDALDKLRYAYGTIGDAARERAAIDRMIALSAQVANPSAAQTAGYRGYLADHLRRDGKVSEGEAVLRAALASADASGDLAARIVAASALAEYLESASRLAGAADAYKLLFELRMADPATRPYDASETLNQLAWVLGELGRHDEAIPLLRAALPRAEAVWRATGASETENGTMDSLTAGLGLAELQTRLADSLGAKGETAESDALFEQALALRSRYFSRPTLPVARGYNAIAFRRNFQGRFEEAEANAAQAIEIYESVQGTPAEDDIVYAKYRYNRAAALLGLGRAAEAVPLLEAGATAQRARFADDHPDLAIVLSTLGRAQAQAGMTAAGYDSAREAAQIARYHRDARLTGGYDEASGGSASQAALTRAIAGDTATRDPLAMAYAALLEAGWLRFAEMSNDGAAFNDAFVAAQDLEQSAVAQVMAEAAVRRAAGKGPLGELIDARQRPAAQIRELEAAATLARADNDAPRTAALRARIDATATELARVDQSISTGFPDFATLTSPAGLGLEEVWSRLKADEALLLLVPSGHSVYAFAVSGDKAAFHRADDAAARVDALVKRLRCRVDEAGCADPAQLDPTSQSDAPLTGVDAYFPRFDRAAAHELYRTLIAPVEAGLGGAKRVYAVAGGALGGLPLSLLVTAFDPATDRAEDPAAAVLRDTAWLGDRYGFVTLPAVSTLRAAQASRAPAEAAPFVGYGAPMLGAETAGTARGVGSARRRVRSGITGVTTVSPETLRQLAPLPGTAAELRTMAGALGAGAGALRLGARATEAAFRADPAIARARVIAIATHGILPNELGDNREPGLVFTPPATASAADDGFLSASEAGELRLAADWLILSACNTAAADGTPGAQSLSGLAKAFLNAGAGALLASHWRVADDVTAVLTVEAMRAANAGAGHADALRQAMVAVRTGKRVDGSVLAGWQPHWAHPAAWAPFVVVAATAD